MSLSEESPRPTLSEMLSDMHRPIPRDEDPSKKYFVTAIFFFVCFLIVSIVLIVTQANIGWWGIGVLFLMISMICAKIGKEKQDMFQMRLHVGIPIEEDWEPGKKEELLQKLQNEEQDWLESSDKNTNTLINSIKKMNFRVRYSNFDMTENVMTWVKTEPIDRNPDFMKFTSRDLIPSSAVGIMNELLGNYITGFSNPDKDDTQAKYFNQLQGISKNINEENVHHAFNWMQIYQLIHQQLISTEPFDGWDTWLNEQLTAKDKAQLEESYQNITLPIEPE